MLDGFTFFMICLSGCVVLTPIVGFFVSTFTRQRVDKLETKISQLEATVRSLEQGQTDQPKSTEAALGQAEHAEKTGDLVEAVKKVAKPLAKKPSSKMSLPPIIKPVEDKPKPVTLGQAHQPKPAQHSPSEKVVTLDKPEATVASVASQPEVPSESIEMKLGTYWFVRIGVVLLLTGLGFLAYFKKQFFVDLAPEAKVASFYTLSFLLGGLGVWLQRKKETLKNYGQVLVAGGCAGVYFTTYAAHIFEPVKVIHSATMALSLLFVWGGFMVWFADRVKSQTIALFATGASFYATYVPLIHAETMSSWVILFSNMILAVASVVFMLRNRWLKMPVLSMVGAYTGFTLWRLRVDEPMVSVALFFGLSLWAVYTAAVFLSRDDSFTDQVRSVFLTANNAAMFVLLSRDVLALEEPRFWVLALSVGAALLICAAGATRVFGRQSLASRSYLTQGLVLVTLGLMTFDMVDSYRAPIIAAESVVLLCMAVRRENFILQVASIVAATIAFIFAVGYTTAGSADYFVAGVSTSVFLLFNAWLFSRRVDHQLSDLFRLRVGCMTCLALAAGLLAAVTRLNDSEVSEVLDWSSVLFLSVAAVLTISLYVLRIREFALLGQAVGLLGIFTGVTVAEEASVANPQLVVLLGLALGQAHWWRWQFGRFTDCCANTALAKRLASGFEALHSLGFVLLLLVWLLLGVELSEKWIWMGALFSFGLAAYAVITRARFLGLGSQVFVVLAALCLVKLCIDGDQEHAVLALVPIAAMLLLNGFIPIALERLGNVPEGVLSAVDSVRLSYRILAAVLGAIWISNYVPNDWLVLVYVAVGFGLVVVPLVIAGEEWKWQALAFCVLGYISLANQLISDQAFWQSLVAVLALFVVQQMCRWLNEGLGVGEEVHPWMIVTAGGLLFLWLTIKVGSEIAGAGALTISWAILAVVYFGAGLGLRERWYRLLGLGTLAIALVSLFPIIWQLSTEMKIASFFVMGTVFIGLGFVYNRFREKIRELL